MLFLWGLIRSSPRQGLSPPYRLTKEQCWTVPTCSYLHWRPTFGSSCTGFVYHRCWHYDNGATSKIDDVLTEHGGPLHVLPPNVHQVGGTILKLVLFNFFGGTSPNA